MFFFTLAAFMIVKQLNNGVADLFKSFKNEIGEIWQGGYLERSLIVFRYSLFARSSSAVKINL